ncbi:MAG: hypothetical protein UU10_C0021G0013 [Parcubacteria group bacterium GW2011_GWF1_40_6]|uniref:Uncharacterized protein n=2 Tax=Candidatus Nomuraibacteriota TaxID=1752729 RepID=A0A0G0T9D9_9BACT|nr:MAG: hypothetical protein UT78_C0002G0015 [Candidatus Nomurabacteria bacterium GW2011_GWF2_40_12]KKR68608.1 MAG: hypothetical protein UU10_C0021G0013 [Parcubacteria group bacterium GW2011_GWF1_40_6]OGJ09380.1 MAG: hypothetical protein A2356_00825 [Candidatus Nomurabacteria bacterium RIFOXYB1_FULL_39_16]
MSDIHGLKVDFRDDTHHAREFLEGMKGEHARDILEKGDKFKDFNGTEYKIVKGEDGELSIHKHH